LQKGWCILPKAPGAGTEWKSVDNFNKTFPTFLKWITKYHKKSLNVIADILDDEDAMQQLRYGAAKEVNAMALKFYKEFKNAKPQDFVKKSPYELHKEQIEKEKKAGVTSLIQTEYIPEDDEDTGTDF
jgi:hypothetical protein